MTRRAFFRPRRFRALLRLCGLTVYEAVLIGAGAVALGHFAIAAAVFIGRQF